MKKKISNYPVEKLVVLNTFFRVFAQTFATIYLSALFILQIGQENWPSISLYAQIFSMAFIFSTTFVKTQSAYLIHKNIIFLELLSLAFFTYFPQNSALLTMMVVMTFVVDIIGEITATSVISQCMSSLSYKANSPRIVASSTMAATMASLAVIAVKTYGNQYIFSGVLAVFLVGHLIFFHLMGKKPRLNITLEKLVPENFHFFKKIKDTFYYCINGPLIILIFGLFIWAQMAKFLSDWLYISTASVVFKTSESLSVFLSISNICLMFIILIFQKFLAKKIMAKFTPSLIIGIIPITFVILSMLGVLFKMPAIGIVFNLFFLFTLKTLHLPSLQITLHSLDPRFKPKVILMMNFCISFCLLILTAAMRGLKGHFNNNLLYISLMIMGIIGIILSIQFEGPFFKNLWKNILNKEGDQVGSSSLAVNNFSPYHEANIFNPHHYFMENFKKPISAIVVNFLQELILQPRKDTSAIFTSIFYDDQITSFERFLLVINTLIHTKDLHLFKKAIIALKFMLNSKKDKKKALKILALVDTEEFRKELESFDPTTSGELSAFITKIKFISQQINECDIIHSIAHRRIKIFTFLNWDYLNKKNQENIFHILKSPNTESHKKLALFLSDPKINSIKNELLNSWKVETENFDRLELLLLYFKSNSEKRKQLQIVLKEGILPDEERNILKNMMAIHIRDKKSKFSQNECLELLFIREWGSLKDLNYSFVLESINEYETLSNEDRIYWKDFHIEFLKKINSKWFTNLVTESL
jgi:hypothetical protein